MGLLKIGLKPSNAIPSQDYASTVTKLQTLEASFTKKTINWSCYHLIGRKKN